MITVKIAIAWVWAWVVIRPFEMRKSYDCLAAVFRSLPRHDPRFGGRFLFRDKDGRWVKIPWWNRTAWAI